MVDPFEGEDSDPIGEGFIDEHCLEMAVVFKTLPNMLELIIALLFKDTTHDQ